MNKVEHPFPPDRNEPHICRHVFPRGGMSIPLPLTRRLEKFICRDFGGVHLPWFSDHCRDVGPRREDLPPVAQVRADPLLSGRASIKTR